jgi:hypothetical protein
MEMARALAAGEQRMVLLQMAEVWQRLADKQNHAEVPTRRTRGGAGPRWGVPDALA